MGELGRRKKNNQIVLKGYGSKPAKSLNIREICISFRLVIRITSLSKQF
jgi:hypothetical protein